MPNLANPCYRCNVCGEIINQERKDVVSGIQLFPDVKLQPGRQRDTRAKGLYSNGNNKAENKRPSMF